MSMVEVELSEPSKLITTRASQSTRGYSHGLCLIRLHGMPLGMIDLELASSGSGDDRGAENMHDSQGFRSEKLAQRIWEEFGPQIRDHLAKDGLPVPDSLPIMGLPSGSDATCIVEREAVRASARPISIVVGTHDRTASMETCLRSLLELDYPDYEILVVDNAPTGNATKDMLRQPEFAGRLSYLREDRPGLAAAHNVGIGHATGEIIAFTDDDVTADRFWLLELARGFRQAELVACVTGLIVPAELETYAQIVAERFWRFNKGFAERVFDSTTPGDDPLYPYAAGIFGSGANMAFDAAMLRAEGGFDPAVGIGTPARGGDDLSAFFNVIASGHRLVYNPGAIVHHCHHAQYAALKRQAFGYGVGLTAYLTKTVVDDPGRLRHLARLGREGLRRALDPRPATASAEEGDWPADLARAERLGMMLGPAAYTWSRLKAGRRTGSGSS